MTKEQEIMNFLHERVFDPVRTSQKASHSVRSGVNLTIARMEQRDALGMMSYFWSAISGTERSVDFARKMKEEGFVRFEEVAKEFSERFTDEWLYS